MKKIKKKSVILSCFISSVVCCHAAMTMAFHVSATDITQSQAVEWVNNAAATKWEKDIDGAYGCQCVDLIMAYYQFLGTKRVRGNATDYQKNALPDGWQRIKSSPQVGDVIVWAGNTKINSGYTLSQYGHIGIVVAVSGNNLTTVETNADGKVSYAQKVKRDASYAACYIRPNFSNQPAHSDCVDVATGDFFVKNNATGTYLNAGGAEKKASLTLSDKKDTNAFQFAVTGSQPAGYYLATKLGTDYVINPFSDTPANGTTVNIYTKDTSGTQLWEFDKSGDGYIIHYKNDPNLCLTASGTNIILKTRDNSASQVWMLETQTQKYMITFDANGNGSTCDIETKVVTNGETYGTLPIPVRDGYEFAGWFTDKNEGIQISDTSEVSLTTNQILYAHWNPVKVIGDCNADGKCTITDAIMLQKWLLGISDTTIADWQMADINGDGMLNIFDFCLLKRILING